MRVLLGILGFVVVGGTFSSVVRTLVIPRPTRSSFTLVITAALHHTFQAAADRLHSYRQKDRVLAPVAPLSILLMLLCWLLSFLLGYALLEAAVSDLSIPTALGESGSSLFTLGFAGNARSALTAVDFAAAATGPVTIGLLVGFLPAVYASYQRRETEVTMLQARAGSPPWGPEILARSSQVDLLPSLGDFYRDWERWAADISESHTSYPVLVEFRSPRAKRHWLIAMLAVMDSAALHLAFNPQLTQAYPRLALRSGFVCLREIAEARRMDYDPTIDRDAALQLSYDDFLLGVDRMRAQHYPMQRTPEEAWPEFRGWRVNYEAIAYRLAYDLDAVPAPWSGPRRTAEAVVTPATPVDTHPSG